MITGTHDTITVQDGDGDQFTIREAVTRPLLAVYAGEPGTNVTIDDALALGIFLILWATNKRAGGGS